MTKNGMVDGVEVFGHLLGFDDVGSMRAKRLKASARARLSFSQS